MRWKWFLILIVIFGVPLSTYAKHPNNPTNYLKKYKQAQNEWEIARKLVDEVQKLTRDFKVIIQKAQEAISHCEAAENLCKEVVSIKYAPPNARGLIANAGNLRDSCKKQIEYLHNLIDIANSHIVLKDCIHKLREANELCAKIKQTFFNEAECVDLLDRASKLYKHAAEDAEHARSRVSYLNRENDDSYFSKYRNKCLNASKKCKEAAKNWHENLEKQKSLFFENTERLKDECSFLEIQSLYYSAQELRKKIAERYELFIKEGSPEEKARFEPKLKDIQESISFFEKETQSKCEKPHSPISSWEEYFLQEQQKKSEFFSGPLSNEYYIEQFYPFGIERSSPAATLVIKVYENETVVHEESLVLPQKKSPEWEDLLTKQGLLWIPETRLEEYGLDLRIQFVYNPKSPFAVIVSLCSHRVGIKCSIALDQDSPFCSCHFQEPPPSQLERLQKPTGSPLNQHIDHFSKLCTGQGERAINETIFGNIVEHNEPLLERLVQELNKDPIKIAQYVQNEIAFVDPFCHEENGVFQSPPVLRDELTTFLDKRGSVWEQCALLVNLLRMGGHRAFYAYGVSTIPRTTLENLLATSFPQMNEQVQVKYPWVEFFDQEKGWVSIFPWRKEIQVHEGYDVYSLLPEKYASADRWIQHYLQADDEIIHHASQDDNDSAAILFSRFVRDQLRKKGLSLEDVGIHRTLLKRQFSSWKDFPRPLESCCTKIFGFLNANYDPNAIGHIEIFPQSNPQHKRAYDVYLKELHSMPIRYGEWKDKHDSKTLHRSVFIRTIKGIEERLPIHTNDPTVGVSIRCDFRVGSQCIQKNQTFWIKPRTISVLSGHATGTSQGILSNIKEKIEAEKREEEQLYLFISLLGNTYFDRCSGAEQFLADIHKVNPDILFTLGLPQFTWAPSHEETRIFSQLDMVHFHAPIPLTAPTKTYAAMHDLHKMVIVDSSSGAFPFSG